MKRIIVCGDRHYPLYRVLQEALFREKDQIESVIAGEARGADLMAKMAAMSHHIPYKGFPANWNLHGIAAGPLRNQEQLDQLLAYPGEKEVWAFHLRLWESRGTRDMIARAQKAGVTVRLYQEPNLKFSILRA